MAGAPAYEPSDKDSAQVETLASYGIPEVDIAKLVINPKTGKPITAKTLRKHYREKLDIGIAKADAKVGESLFIQACGAPAVYDAAGNCLREEQKRVPSAAIFWMKARRGWRDNDKLEVSGNNGGPIPLVITKNESNY